MANELSVNTNPFSSMSNFEDAQRVAKVLSSSDLVPANYRNNIANTMVALEMANRINVSPFQVMQNLDIIQGKPSWRSTFIIAALNSCGRFKALRFEFVGEDTTSDSYGCRAYTFDKETDEKIVGPLVTWAMVKSEGWLAKSGSKWKTMPELMFQYRAASFFGRLYAPDILNGMQSVEEIKDISTIDVNHVDLTNEEKEQSRIKQFIENCTDITKLDQFKDIELSPENKKLLVETLSKLSHANT